MTPKSCYNRFLWAIPQGRQDKPSEGKVPLVTGVSLGIGRAAPLAFARDGAKVTLADADIKGGEETVRLIENAGGESSHGT